LGLPTGEMNYLHFSPVFGFRARDGEWFVSLPHSLVYYLIGWLAAHEHTPETFKILVIHVKEILREFNMDARLYASLMWAAPVVTFRMVNRRRLNDYRWSVHSSPLSVSGDTRERLGYLLHKTSGYLARGLVLVSVSALVYFGLRQAYRHGVTSVRQSLSPARWFPSKYVVHGGSVASTT
jgi:hypothetical protein